MDTINLISLFLASAMGSYLIGAMALVRIIEGNTARKRKSRRSAR